MKTRALLLILLACLVAAPAMAAKLTREQLALFYGKDSRVKVPVDTMPWQTIGQLETAGHLRCSGTLVAPDVVLTAGHCFVGKKGRLDPAVSFMLGIDGDTYDTLVGVKHVYVSQVLLKGIIRHPHSMTIPPAVAPYDFAFVRLSQPAGKEFGYLPLFQGNAAALKSLLVRNNWRVTQAGYPVDTNGVMMAHKSCQAIELQDDGRLGHRCNTLPGDSGSPILAQQNGKYVVIGLQSSAPSARDRQRANNMALTAPVFGGLLQRFIAGKL
ncbi:trypsin-like serine peptidase [Paludibacterium yongneupense]|uniref:trypsin-like serine peptidase n=1 Tax=Paludibacterium yongneupense TaxID=400061 RepID=UPI00040EF25B|nr:trypsin-like serine protease [Paludibacterium yongneupense]